MWGELLTFLLIRAVTVHISSTPYTNQYVLVNWEITNKPQRGEFTVNTNANVVILPDAPSARSVSISAEMMTGSADLNVSLTTTKGSTATPPACASPVTSATSDNTCPSNPQ